MLHLEIVDFGTPAFKKTVKLALSTGDIPPEQKPMAEKTASQSTAKHGQNFHDICEALYPLVAILGYVAGFWLYGYRDKIRRKRQYLAKKSMLSSVENKPSQPIENQRNKDVNK